MKNLMPKRIPNSVQCSIMLYGTTEIPVYMIDGFGPFKTRELADEFLRFLLENKVERQDYGAAYIDFKIKREI